MGLRGLSFKKVAGLLLASMVIAGLWQPNPARADQSVAVTPTSSEYKVDPGGQTKGTIQVLNQANTPFSYKVYVTPYSVTGEDYDPSFSPTSGATNVADWIKLSSATGSLRAYSGSPIEYTINVPANAKPGSYYGVIFAETESKVEGSGVATLKRVGTVLYIRVNGPVVEAGALASWQVPWLQKPDLTQILRLANTGSVYYNAEVHTEVRDVFGGKKFSYEQKRKVLPEKIRRITITWPDTPPFGLFVVSGKVGFLGQTVPLSNQYVLVMTDEIRRIIVIAFCVAVVIILLRLWRKRRKKKRAQKQAGDQGHEA